MSTTTIFIIIALIWVIGGAVFLKDYLLGERQVKNRKRGAPTLQPKIGYGIDRGDD